MVKFVGVQADDGALYKVNPERIAYIADRRGGGCNIVFEAISGGLHKLGVGLPTDAVADVLEAASRAPEPQPAAPRPKQMARRSRSG